jgi:hypothetical protein
VECPHLTDIASRTTSRVMHRSHLLSPPCTGLQLQSSGLRLQPADRHVRVGGLLQARGVGGALFHRASAPQSRARRRVLEGDVLRGLEDRLPAVPRGVLPLAAGAFADKTDDRMANLWMYAVNRYAMAMHALGCVDMVKQITLKLGLSDIPF